MMDLDLVLLLQRHHLIRTLLRLLDLLPGAHFLLLKQGNTIGKELRVSLDTTRARGLAKKNIGLDRNDRTRGIKRITLFFASWPP